MICIGLDNPKSSINVGHALRAAGCFGAQLMAVSGYRYHRACTDTMNAVGRVPLVTTDDLHRVIPFSCVPVAVELHNRAVSILNYVHPASAFYVFGAEDATLGNRVLPWCRDVIYIPTSACLNLAACVNVVLYDRTAKAPSAS